MLNKYRSFQNSREKISGMKQNSNYSNSVAVYDGERNDGFLIVGRRKGI